MAENFTTPMVDKSIADKQNIGEAFNSLLDSAKDIERDRREILTALEAIIKHYDHAHTEECVKSCPVLDATRAFAKAKAFEARMT